MTRYSTLTIVKWPPFETQLFSRQGLQNVQFYIFDFLSAFRHQKKVNFVMAKLKYFLSYSLDLEYCWKLFLAIGPFLT